MNVIQKRKKGQILNSNERQIILNLMHYLKEKNSGKSVSEVIREISKATGCSERTIYKIRKAADNGEIGTPNKTRYRKKENKNSRNVKYDSYVKSSIRRKIHNYVLHNIAPTLNAILSLVNNDPDLPNFKRSTLHTLLKEIGFVYQQKGKKSLLTERCDLVKSRQEYLKSIRRFREEKRSIVYTGETLISLIKKVVKKEHVDVNNELKSNVVINPTVSENMVCCNGVNMLLMNNGELVNGATLVCTVEPSNFGNAVRSGAVDVKGTITSVEHIANYTNNVVVPTVLTDTSYLLGETSKKLEDSRIGSATNDCEVRPKKNTRELRFSVMHAGGEGGFLEGVEHIVLLKKKNEDVDNYEKWFVSKLLPKIPSNSVIVIDNNVWCRKKKGNLPDESWKKHQIKNWLTSKNVNIGKLNRKKDLLAAANDLPFVYNIGHNIQEIAGQRGIVLVSLPPLHYELNPLNIVLAHVKSHVCSNMKSFKVRKIKKLVSEGFYTLSENNWLNYIHHVQEMEDLFWAVDEIQEANETVPS